MLVLRVTAGSERHLLRLAQDEVRFGSSPIAEVTLQGVGWPTEVATARVVGDQLVVRTPRGAEGRVAVGGQFKLGPVLIEVVALGVAGIAFGDYDDDPIAAAVRPATFELEPDPGPPAARHGSSLTPTAHASAGPQIVAAPAEAEVGATTMTAQSPERPGTRSLAFVAPTFADSLTESLRRAPFFVLSAALHGLLFLLFLILVDTTDPNADKHGLGAMEAGLAVDEDIGTTEEMVDAFDLVKDTPEFEDVFSELPMPELELPSVQTPPAPDPLAELARELENSEVNPSNIGVVPTSDLFRRRAPKRRAPVAPATPMVEPAELTQAFAGGHATAANRRAADLVRDMLGRGRSGSGATLDDLKADDLLVVTGAFDKIGRVLEALRLPYRRTNMYEVKDGQGPDFNDYKVVFWNCGDPLPPDQMRAVAKRLEAYVRRGGYLFTTDWAVAHVVQLAFPGYLTTTGKDTSLPEMVVDIRPARGQERHPLLEGVFLPGTRGRWWLEELAFDVKIGPHGAGAVEVLVESPMLKDTLGVSPIVAATFKHGRGRVLHAMGHYFQEAGNMAGTVASHRLAMNFVLERLGQK